MRRLRRFVRRLTWWLRTRPDEERLRSEIQQHIAMQTADNLRAGLSPAEARRQAVLKFGALEAMTRLRMQQELERLWQDSGTTMIMVTHDIEEAVYLADKIVVMGHRREGFSEVIPLALRRPRDRSDPEFVEIREILLKRFHLSAH